MHYLDLLKEETIFDNPDYITFLIAFNKHILTILYLKAELTCKLFE